MRRWRDISGAAAPPPTYYCSAPVFPSHSLPAHAGRNVCPPPPFGPPPPPPHYTCRKSRWTYWPGKIWTRRGISVSLCIHDWTCFDPRQHPRDALVDLPGNSETTGCGAPGQRPCGCGAPNNATPPCGRGERPDGLLGSSGRAGDGADPDCRGCGMMESINWSALRPNKQDPAKGESQNGYLLSRRGRILPAS
eukprot:COSAG01_NODE_16103_length_1276_cov_1.075149_3_plen_192_part_01